MSENNTRLENSFIKFVKGLRFFEWAIIVVIFAFVGLFIWVYTRPAPTVEQIQQEQSKVKVRIYEFWGQGCPHCAAAEPFLKSLDKGSEEVSLHQYEVYYSTENQKKNEAVASVLGKEAGGVPFIVIGDEVFQGYDNEKGIGKEIQDRVNYCVANKCPDKAGEVLGYSKLDWSAATEDIAQRKSSGYANLSISEAKKMIEGNKDDESFVILDVRTVTEYNENKIDSKAINIDVESDDFSMKIEQLDKSKTYLVYCRTGRRSKIAVEAMAKAGFDKLYNLEGGTVEWFNSTKK